MNLRHWEYNSRIIVHQAAVLVVRASSTWHQTWKVVKNSLRRWLTNVHFGNPQGKLNLRLSYLSLIRAKLFYPAENVTFQMKTLQAVGGKMMEPH